MQVGNSDIRKFEIIRKVSAISVHDVLNDTISRIKNAYTRPNMEYAYVINTNFVRNILNKLSLLGYVGSVEVLNRELKVELIKDNNSKGIEYIKRKTTPGRRLYMSYRDLPRSKFGVTGQFILSTSKGILTDHEAKELKIGGEVLFEIFSTRRFACQ